MSNLNKSWIYIGGLPFNLTEGDIICAFSQYGEVSAISLARDRDTGVSRGFCFLEYQDPRSCELAVDNLHETAITGRKIKVHYVTSTNAIKNPLNVAPCPGGEPQNSDAPKMLDNRRSPDDAEQKSRLPMVMKEQDKSRSRSNDRYRDHVRDKMRRDRRDHSPRRQSGRDRSRSKSRSSSPKRRSVRSRSDSVEGRPRKSSRDRRRRSRTRSRDRQRRRDDNHRDTRHRQSGSHEFSRRDRDSHRRDRESSHRHRDDRRSSRDRDSYHDRRESHRRDVARERSSRHRESSQEDKKNDYRPRSRSRDRAVCNKETISTRDRQSPRRGYRS